MKLSQKFHYNVLAAVVLGLLFPTCFYAQQGGEVFKLNAENLKGENSVRLDKLSWRYHAGDDVAWANPQFDDSNWKLLTNDEINSDPAAALEDWQGRAWFRLRIRVDESLVNYPLAVRVWQWGASEIYVDGKLVQSYGVIQPNSDQEFNPRGLFFPIVFTTGGVHTIAVRYSFNAERDFRNGVGGWLVRGYFLPGFRLSIEDSQNAALRLEEDARAERLYYVFVGLFLALGLVHFLLYIFYRRAPSNLFYSLFVTGIAISFWLQGLTSTAHFSAILAQINEIIRLDVQSLAVISLLAFLYVEFVGRPSKFFWILLALWLLGIVLHVGQIWREFPYTLIMLIVTLADCLRIMGRALIKRRDGAWIIAVGVVLLVVGVLNNISIERDFFEIPVWLYHLNLYLTVLSVPLAVSIYLARNTARTNLNLESQLEQVQELSAKQLEHERSEAELRLAHERTQAENERRARELEEARQLQLSMLPAQVPQLPNLEIAAYMKPATEVGGDYYDFHVSENGTLTIAVGDATGHGLRAGSVVTATKSLFNAFASDENIPQIFTKTSTALKKMNLRGLFMAMTMLKVKDNRLTLCAAGMPSALLYRAATKQIEEISLRAVPLGSVATFVYQAQEFALSANDCLVVMSDGFPEMFNEDGEMLDDEVTIRILKESAEQTSQEIINRFIKAGEKWAGDRPPDDDVTFVVLKIKD